MSEMKTKLLTEILFSHCSSTFTFDDVMSSDELKVTYKNFAPTSIVMLESRMQVLLENEALKNIVLLHIAQLFFYF